MRRLLSLGEAAISTMYGGCGRDESEGRMTIILGRQREVEQRKENEPLPIVIENN